MTFRRNSEKTLKNDFSGIRPYQGAGPPQGIYTPHSGGLLDLAGEGLGARLHRVVPPGTLAHLRADNWHLPLLENRLRSSADRAGVPAEHLEPLLRSPVYSRNAPRLLSMADNPALPGQVIERRKAGPGANCDWITLDPSGTHVCIDPTGNIASGPSGLENKPINQLPTGGDEPERDEPGQAPSDPTTRTEAQAELKKFSREASALLWSMGHDADAQRLAEGKAPLTEAARKVVQQLAQDRYSPWMQSVTQRIAQPTGGKPSSPPPPRPTPPPPPPSQPAPPKPASQPAPSVPPPSAQGSPPPLPTGYVTPVGGQRESQPWNPQRIASNVKTIGSLLSSYGAKGGKSEQLRESVVQVGDKYGPALQKSFAEHQENLKRVETGTNKIQSLLNSSAEYRQTGKVPAALLPQVKALLQANETLSARTKQLEAGGRALKNQAVAEVHAQMKKQMMLPHAVKFNTVYDDSGKISPRGRVGKDETQPASPELRKKVDNVVGFLQGLLAGASGKGQDPKAAAQPFQLVVAQIAKGSEQRCFHDKGRIHLDANADEATIAHEIGHAIEHQYPQAAAAARAFLMKRVGNEKMTPLKDVFPGSGYADWEEGRKDDFAKTFGNERSAYYAGKHYDNGTTEMLSRGIEQLYRSPSSFAKNDPEFFHFVTGVLNGSLR
jgi:hypothetical protein